MRVLLLLVTSWVPLLQAKTQVRRESPAANANALSVDNSAHALTIDADGSLIATRAKSEKTQVCKTLKNQGSYFTVDIEVGANPGKTFDVVADTGSGSVIVNSCTCQPSDGIGGSCDATDPPTKCFCDADVSKKSNSCNGNDIDSTTTKVNTSSGGNVSVVTMGFGSGEIEAMIASDSVHIGSASAEMKDQLLLMIKRKLDLTGTFEGILGLGIPEDHTAAADPATWSGDSQVKKKVGAETYVTKGFLEEAGITRFSICLQDSNVASGVLRIDSPELTNPLGSIGTKHWGLDFRGISVNSKTPGAVPGEAIFCKDIPAGAPASQRTPCGAIPDSGTTLILGPQEQLKLLYEEICDQWPRCKTELDTNPDANGVSKRLLVETLLANCSEWLPGSTEGLDELPELNFHVRGSEGTEQILSFKGSHYIESGDLDSSFFAGRKTLAKEPVLDFFARTRRARSLSPREQEMVCLLALGAVEYKTDTNGPVWILGLPLFYSHQVSFEAPDRSDATSKSSIQIVRTTPEQPCSPCGANMLEDFSTETSSKRSPMTPRRIKGPARGPTKTLSGPL